MGNRLNIINELMCMVTIKENIENLNLNIEIPEIQHTYHVLPIHGYDRYEYKTINGQKCIEVKGLGDSKIPLKCVINLETKKILEYAMWNEDDFQVVSSIDKDGNMPFH